MTTRWTADDVRATGLRVRGDIKRAVAMADAFNPMANMPKPEPNPKKSKEDRMSKTERRYRFEVLDRREDVELIVYAAITLHMGNNHAYTPDWVVFRKDGKIELIEIKGNYRLGSLQRSKLAYDQARVEFPRFIFRWAELDKTTNGWFTIG